MAWTRRGRLLALLLSSLWPALAQQRCSYTVAIGSREDAAVSSLPATLQQTSSAFSDYLTNSAGRRLQAGSGCPGPVSFTVVPATAAASGGAVPETLPGGDFGFLSHTATWCMSSEHDYTPLLRTLAADASGSLSDPPNGIRSGSVLLARADSAGVQQFSDCRGRTVGSTDPESVLDWMLAAQALLRHGVYLPHEARQVAFFGHGAAGAADCMRAVLDRDVDVCVVASHRAEAIFGGGDLDPRDFKFLGPTGSQSCTGGGLGACVHTQLFAPEQHFFGAMPGVPPTTVREVSQALLDLNVSSAAALTSESGPVRFVEPTLWHRLESVLLDLSIAAYDPVRRVTRCDLSQAPAAPCPPGYVQKTPSEIAGGCEAKGIACPGPRCVCDPCRKGYKNGVQVFMGVMAGPEGADAAMEAHQCLKMERCAVLEMDSPVTLTVVDSMFQVHGLGAGTVTYLLHSSEECSMAVPNSERSFSQRNDTVSGTAMQDLGNPGTYIASFSILSAGNRLLEVFVNGSQIAESPSWITVVNKPCREGMVRGMINGPCVCPQISYDISGQCVQASVLLPSIILPVVALLALVAYAYHIRQTMAIGAAWVIRQDEITFFDPQEVLGVGTFGWIVAGAYKGVNVAIRRAIPNEHDIQARKSHKRMSMKNLPNLQLGNLSRTPSVMATRLRSSGNVTDAVLGVACRDQSGHTGALSMPEIGPVRDLSGHRKLCEGLNGSPVASMQGRPRSISVQNLQIGHRSPTSGPIAPMKSLSAASTTSTLEDPHNLVRNAPGPANVKANSSEPVLGSLERPRPKSLSVETSEGRLGNSHDCKDMVSPAASSAHGFTKDRQLPMPSPTPRSFHERALIRSLSQRANSITSPSMDEDINVSAELTGTGKHRLRRALSMGGAPMMSFASVDGSHDLENQTRFQMWARRVRLCLGLKLDKNNKKHTFQSLKKELIQNMKVVSKLSHPNIILIHGAIVHNTNVPMLVMERMDNGSLHDVLYSGTASLEGEIMVSILRDISSGMAYLHAASIVHGDLKPDHILMDSQFRAKISGYGFNFKHVTGIEEAFAPWTAPEVLLGADGDMRSDVYAFGITVWELFTRRVPFEDEDAYYTMFAVCSEPIPGEEPYRPAIPSNCPHLVAKLMTSSWAHDPAERPPFDALCQQVAVLDLTGRQATTDVLYDVFPKHVAEKLIAGEKVDPEKKECVSIFFSDIVGFTNMSDVMDASAVSDMLDRLYSKFDAISREMNVFKVETIGDAFIACTNLVEDQADHAARLAQFALAAMEAAHNTPVQESDPSKGSVQIRVGLHCGPVVASVIGTRKKKYCLLGDTVNTASRMESHGLAGHIHVSRSIAKMIRKHAPGMIIESRGLTEIKGKGKMQTYWIKGGSYSLSQDPQDASMLSLAEGPHELESGASPRAKALARALESDLDASISIHNANVDDSAPGHANRSDAGTDAGCSETSTQLMPKDIRLKMQNSLAFRRSENNVVRNQSKLAAEAQASQRAGEEPSFMRKALNTIGSMGSPRRMSRPSRAHSYSMNEGHSPFGLLISGLQVLPPDTSTRSAGRSVGSEGPLFPSRSLPMRIKDALVGKPLSVDLGPVGAAVLEQRIDESEHSTFSQV